MNTSQIITVPQSKINQFFYSKLQEIKNKHCLNVLNVEYYHGNSIHKEKRKFFLNYDKYEAGFYNYLDYKTPKDTLTNDHTIFPYSSDCEFFTGLTAQNFTEVTRYYLTTQQESIYYLENLNQLNILNTECCNKTNKNYTTGFFRPVRCIFHEFDLLLDNGSNVGLIFLNPNEKKTYKYIKKLPVFISRMYGWFLLAELFMTSHGWGNEVKKLLLGDNDKINGWHNWNISMKKRLYASFTTQIDEDKVIHKDFCRTPVIAIIDGIEFNYVLSYVDCSAMFGGAARSLLKAAQSVGCETAYKELLSKTEKEKMYEYPMFLDRYIPYALDDLKLPVDILHLHQRNVCNVYLSLGLSDAGVKTPMTLGKTVNDLYKHTIYKKFGIDDEENILSLYFLDSEIFKFSNAEYFARDVRRTSAIAAKCFGGRAVNNKPTTFYYKGGLIADFDYASFYGNIMRIQPYPIGRPRVIDFDSRVKNNQYWTLLETEKFLNKRAIPLIWEIVVDTIDSLSFDFDLIPSWISNTKSDTEVKKLLLKQYEISNGDEFDLLWSLNTDDGLTKYFLREIYNGVITTDILELINSFSKKYRDEIKSKIIVKAVVYYDKNDRVKTFEELKKSYENHKGVNTVKIKGNKIISTSDKCHKFYLFESMGELIIDALLARRKLYDKKNPVEKPMNNTFKYLINTRAGVEMSKYFLQASPIVGNNITARGRVGCYVAEKILNGFESVTDGLAADVNKVVYPYKIKNISFENLISIDKEKHLKKFRYLELKSLGDYKHIEINRVGRYLLTKGENKGKNLDDWYIVKIVRFIKYDGSYDEMTSQKANKKLEDLALEHIKILFPNLSMFNGNYKKLVVEDSDNKTPIINYEDTDCGLSFEIKDIFNTIVTHGTADYLLFTDDKEAVDAVIKMRSYEGKKEHYRVVVNDDNFPKTEKMNVLPSKKFLFSLVDKNGVIPRSEPFIKEGILKINEYLRRKETFDAKGLLPGDSYLKTGMLTELSLSQFKFKTLKQYKEFDKYHTSLKNKYGQGLEMFFVDDSGYLKYGEMLKTLEDLIENQEQRFKERKVKNLNEYFDVHRHANRQGKHPNLELQTLIKEKIKGDDHCFVLFL